MDASPFQTRNEERDDRAHRLGGVHGYDLRGSVSLAGAAPRLDAPGGEHVTTGSNVRTTMVGRARASLDDACDELDDAVGSLSEIEGETVMVSADLVTLLLRVVAARRHLNDLERAPVAPRLTLLS